MKGRFTIKIAGFAGQGIKSSGLIISKALKRSGFFVFGYTEYPSLIRGGHNVFQIEISDRKIQSISKDIDVLLALNQDGLNFHLNEFDKDSGVVIVDVKVGVSEEQQAKIDNLNLKLFQIPLDDLALNSGGSAIMRNTVSIGAIWKTLGLDIENLKNVVEEVFDKTDEIKQANLKAVDAGYNSIKENFDRLTKNFRRAENLKKQLIITGNESLALGAIASGVKLYSSYPMTPASSILTNLAKWSAKSKMLVKQTEDEMTASAMCLGANYAGTRALCGTSGGGVDLMSEHISLSGMSEIPLTIILAQRHGPATGAPTWTGQGDLEMAIHTGHGEFPRLVLSISDGEDAFYLISQALNYADKYRLPVIVLTEKYIAENFYTIEKFDQSKIIVDRGDLLEQDELPNSPVSYEITKSGLSYRWIPGTYNRLEKRARITTTMSANSDEHNEKGYSTEDEKIIKRQSEKRFRKFELLRKELPGPEIIGDEKNADIIFVTFGSNKGILEDAKRVLENDRRSVKIIHYSYLWPLKTETLLKLKDDLDKVYIVEQNYNGQFARLIKRETGIEFKKHIRRYDSKPFYIEDILKVIK